MILVSPFEITVRVRVFVSSFHSALPFATFEPQALTLGGASNPESVVVIDEAYADFAKYLAAEEKQIRIFAPTIARKR